MNRSYSKIRHIKEANILLENKTVINEQDDDMYESSSNNRKMFEMEMRKIKLALHDIKRLTHSDPQTVDHICNMINNVSLPRLEEFAGFK